MIQYLRGDNMDNFIEIRGKLNNLKSEKLKDFSSNLSKSKYELLGVKLPLLKDIAKEIIKDNAYLEYLNHDIKYFEELQIQFFIVGMLKDYQFFCNYINSNWYKVDNWAICDSSCACFKKIILKNKEEFKLFMKDFYKGNKDKTFCVRFIINALMDAYLGEDLNDEDCLKIYHFFAMIDNLDYDMGPYYVKMGIAWCLQVGMVKKHDITIKFLKEKNSLSDFTFNKALQKMIESYRIDEDEKIVLRGMKRK